MNAFKKQTKMTRKHLCLHSRDSSLCWMISAVSWRLLNLLSQLCLSKYIVSYSGSLSVFLNCVPAAILDDPMECSRGERLAITLAKESINRSSNRSTTGKLEVDIFELLRDSEYETGETSEYSDVLYHFWDLNNFSLCALNLFN